ncbi:MAG: hypothetical protein ABI367_12175 [Mucilaginibacter sp.]
MTIVSKPIIVFIAAITLLTACKRDVTPEKLYGNWRYVKIENPGTNPPSTDPDWKLKLEHPSIVFSKNNELTIWWNGKILSHGTFGVDVNNIRYKEILEGGRTSEFPFYVSKLTDSEIVFETLGPDGSRVTAVKQ